MSEWFKELVLKTSDSERDRGFESHPLRHNTCLLYTSFSGLMDTIGAIVVAAVVLIMGTFGMNGVVYLYVREKFEAA